ncbi:Uncharacterised protein [Mycobacteroides abscessus subsp. abscessus]|nr:Uncharacterised protein [Mycobacteroides abscessus subsp. abscessus]
MQRLLADQAERGGIPEQRGAAVAEDHLVAVGSGEQLLEALADAAHEVLDGCLPVRGTEKGSAGSHERLQLFGAHLGGAAAKASVGGQ